MIRYTPQNRTERTEMTVDGIFRRFDSVPAQNNKNAPNRPKSPLNAKSGFFYAYSIKSYPFLSPKREKVHPQLRAGLQIKDGVVASVQGTNLPLVKQSHLETPKPLVESRRVADSRRGVLFLERRRLSCAQKLTARSLRNILLTLRLITQRLCGVLKRSSRRTKGDGLNRRCIFVKTAMVLCLSSVIWMTPKHGFSTVSTQIKLSAIEQIESSGNPLAVSPVGCRGLYQIADITRKHFNEVHRTNILPEQLFLEEINRKIAVWYFGWLSQRWGVKSVSDLLIAYNWGIGNFQKWVRGGRKGTLPLETQNYIKKYSNLTGVSYETLLAQKRL